MNNEQTATWLSKLGGRKFVSFVIVVIAALSMELFGPKGLSETLSMLLFGLVSSFGAANVVAGFGGGKTIKLGTQKVESAPQAAEVDNSSNDVNGSTVPDGQEAGAAGGRIDALEAAAQRISGQNQAIVDSLLQLQKVVGTLMQGRQ